MNALRIDCPHRACPSKLRRSKVGVARALEDHLHGWYALLFDQAQAMHAQIKFEIVFFIITHAMVNLYKRVLCAFFNHMPPLKSIYYKLYYRQIKGNFNFFIFILAMSIAERPMIQNFFLLVLIKPAQEIFDDKFAPCR